MRWRHTVAIAAPLLGCIPALAFGADKPLSLPTAATEVETVRFADPRWAPVRMFKGPSQESGRRPLEQNATNTELVSFAAGRVAVVRGPSAAAVLSGPPNVAPGSRVETVRFTDSRLPLVTVVRGPAHDDGLALFGAAGGGELDRVAFAVDGVESGHGATLAMWRPDLDGPQGPMQISAAAALDVGGGDRFDLRSNRLLGRAYLAQMFRRYGNWGDALAAYNWGPGNLDQWILAGRPAYRLPFGVARYVLRVLHDALIAPTRL
jgi:hypothetical protein